jgi:hypothetical protein
MKQLAGLVLALSFLLVLPGEALARSSGSSYTPFGMKVLDVALVRPGMVAVSVVSNAFFLGTFPLTFAIGIGEQSANLFVIAPWRFTAARFPGEFGAYQDGGTAFGAGSR